MQLKELTETERRILIHALNQMSFSREFLLGAPEFITVGLLTDSQDNLLKQLTAGRGTL